MNYIEIEDSLFCVETNEVLREGDFYTVPYITKVGANVGNKFVLYTKNDDQCYSYGYVVTGEQGVLDINCETYERFSLSKVVCRTQESCDLYVKVFEFAFEDSLNEEKKKVLAHYLDLISDLSSRSEKEMYELFAPEFLAWANDVLKV